MSVSSRYAFGDGPGRITPDGCSVELYSLLPPGRREAELIASTVAAGATVLELGAGAGRVTRSLADHGLRVVAVDESPDMLARISGVETCVGRIEELDLGRKFDVVVLGSHLINVPDDDAAVSLLQTCARHVARDGHVLAERHPAQWFDTLQPVEVCSHEIVYRLDGVAWESADVVTATVSYTAAGSTWTQTFTTRRVTDDDVVRLLLRSGLSLDGYVDAAAAWIKARSVREVRQPHQ